MVCSIKKNRISGGFPLKNHGISTPIVALFQGVPLLSGVARVVRLFLCFSGVMNSTN